MKLFRNLILHILAYYVNLFFHNNPHIKLVAVVGSVGKTTTKSTIVDVLSTQKKVRTNRGNFNAELSAPLEILGVESPSNPRSVMAWLRVLKDVRAAANQRHDIDIIVQEFGIDRPGEMAKFGKYIRPNILVVTAISPEHMEFFGNIKTVAREEFALGKLSDMVIYNKDDIAPEYTQYANSQHMISYGTTAEADYYIEAGGFTAGRGFNCQLNHHKQASRKYILPVVGEHQLRIAAGASAVAIELGLDTEQVLIALEKFTPVSGRMNILQGIAGSTILDDSYNSSPLAVKSALKTLYRLPAKTKIAVLGDMNELGDTAAAEHQTVGELCDPKQINHLIAVGEYAKQHIAPVAEKRGCLVTSFTKATDATSLLKTLAKKDTILLFKGSQGGIYLEEAIKPLLKNPADRQKLVRQSDAWLEKKRHFFDQT